MAIINKCYFGGEIVGEITSNNNKKKPIVRFVIRMYDDKLKNTLVKLSAYDNIANDIYKNCKTGDLIVAECTYSSFRITSKKYVNRFIITRIEYLSDPRGYENTKEITENTEEETYPWGY